MKQTKLIGTLCGVLLLAASQVQAQTATTYELTITNGSQMPLSPGVIYSREGGEAAVQIGDTPTMGFVQLCQMGMPALRLNEIKADSTVHFATQTMAPILPGESRSLDVEVRNPNLDSIHLETMYGKSKDVCGVATVNSHSLTALKQHVSAEIVLKDNTLQTGAFSNPAIPAGSAYPSPMICNASMDAISCLRELATVNPGKVQVHFFAGYFPSLVTALEMKYGAADVQTLLFPTSGAIQLKLKLKH